MTAYEASVQEAVPAARPRYVEVEQQPIRVLVVEDEPLYARLIQDRLSQLAVPQFVPSHALTLGDALERLETEAIDIVLLDLMLPDSRGIETITRVRERAPAVPVVVLTGYEGDALAISALKEGAQDYLIKGSEATVLVRSLRYAIERSRTQTQLVQARRSLRSTQMQLIQAEKMESVGRLAAGVAHEVKNPLAVLRMGVDVIAKCADESDPELAGVLADMKDAVGRAQRIITGLLDFSVPTELQLRPCDAGQVLEDALRMVRHETKSRGIEPVLDLAEERPPVVLDRAKIEQVFINLMLNAIDAMPEGGRLEARLSVKVLSEAGDGVGRRSTDYFRLGERVVIVDIDDTGPGIAPEYLSRLFDPFFTTKTVGKGTGLGLSIAKNIVVLHGGRLDIENRPEGGARARVILVA